METLNGNPQKIVHVEKIPSKSKMAKIGFGLSRGSNRSENVRGECFAPYVCAYLNANFYKAIDSDKRFCFNIFNFFRKKSQRYDA